MGNGGGSERAHGVNGIGDIVGSGKVPESAGEGWKATSQRARG